MADGRAILIGEQITPSGDRVDIQLKGAGQTRFSRRGDGRAALGPMLREYVISEAMHALGIPTTRSLAVVKTGEPVYRETVLDGAVLTRVAASHIRVGTMQWAAAHDDQEAVRALADYTRARHYPELADSREPHMLHMLHMLHMALFDAILGRQASLIARWQLVGFVLDGMRAKLGLFTQEDTDKALVDDLLAWMQRRSADFTNTFRSLTSGRLVGDSTPADPEVEAWHRRLAARRGRQPQSPAEAEDLMRRHNPAFIPRNHNVEEALEAATSADDFSGMERLLDVLATPYDHGRDLPMFSTPSTSGSGDRPYRTFCGT